MWKSGGAGDWVQHCQMIAKFTRNDRFQPVSAVARPDLNVCSGPDSTLLRRSKGQSSGSRPLWEVDPPSSPGDWIGRTMP
jgi:hypothetical protein